MSEPNPPRRPLATFLRAATPAAAPDDPAAHGAEDGVGPASLQAQAVTPATAGMQDDPVPADTAAVLPDDAVVAPPDSLADTAPAAAGDTPSFLARPAARLRAPRWQWGLVGALAALLVLQIILADRARWAADAGSRPWVAALCGVLRCSLPPWHEPSAFTMTSREIRPLPGHAGVLQVRASIRNDARWAQGWPKLRLSLSDADGRVIGVGVFTPAHYLGKADATGTPEHGTLEPGQSARIAFRVREPAASTDAFTFEFL
ncbi:DUF3426 domain-containing protein [Stenotrophomonas sp. 24(2023)]|uniref:DUF3426 domain-containing protein n=1 Tax=Stenotrophomonas sp. 24(2023) TaxID=3068324 RepID=UPI0027DF7B1E|nr:DUF3426 domain-containing protein [Stenotrophomonas sp. 24(2023)]WMJ70707.1 DUF3426 domain-containing protein [Stenotrophomonas sp. 24(2023)]